MKYVTIIARPHHEEAVNLARAIVERYPRLEIVSEQHVGKHGKIPWAPENKLVARAQLVVALGGDGTLIHACWLLGARSVPILGINLGSLGFMTETPVSDAFRAIDAVIAGQAHVDSRMKLRFAVYRKGTVVIEGEVLNDIVINKGVLARMSSHEVWLDRAFVATYQADGMIFSTPTGSTAYSLAAGGPIVHPAVDCVVVTPICPHALTQRPIIIPGDQRIRVQLAGDASDVFLSADGQLSFPLHSHDWVEVQKSRNRALLVRNERLDYFAVLRQKLRWGERGTRNPAEISFDQPDAQPVKRARRNVRR